MTAAESSPRAQVPNSTVRLARALVTDAKRRGVVESPSVIRVARLPLPEDAVAG